MSDSTITESTTLAPDDQVPDEQAVMETRLAAELERLRAERAMLKQLQHDIETGAETKRTVLLFVAGAVATALFVYSISLILG